LCKSLNNQYHKYIGPEDAIPNTTEKIIFLKYHTFLRYEVTFLLETKILNKKINKEINNNVGKISTNIFQKVFSIIIELEKSKTIVSIYKKATINKNSQFHQILSFAIIYRFHIKKLYIIKLLYKLKSN
jgi:hypothetical protein